LFMRSRRQFDLLTLGKFAVVGFINTFVGYAVILSALWSGCGDIVSNMIGYATGLFVSYALNSRWTFSTGRPARAAAGWRYLLVFAIAYAANLMVVIIAGAWGVTHSAWAHLAGLGVYSILFYLGSANFVFARRL